MIFWVGEHPSGTSLELLGLNQLVLENQNVPLRTDQPFLARI
jgi:hypothetical protein